MKMNEPIKSLDDTYRSSMINEPKTTAHKRMNGTYRCCMVAEQVRENGNRAKTMADQDKERVPVRDGELKTWDLDKTKVRIYVDRTKWQKRYPCRPRLTQRLRRPAFQAVEGCKPDWQGIKHGTEKLLKRLPKKTEMSDMAEGHENVLLRLRRRKGESASAWRNTSYERYQSPRQMLG